MKILDNSTKYGALTRLIHWLSFLLFIAVFAIAILKNSNEEYKYLMAYHKQIGLVLLGLAVLRLLWTAVNFHRRPASGVLAKLGHLAILALVLLVPLTAFLRQVGRENDNKFLVELGNQWHGTLAWTLLVLIVGHVAVAFYHQLRGTKLLQRMIG